MPETVTIDKEAFDELAGAVSDLRQGVEDLKQGKLDDSTVEKIGADVLEKLQAANPAFQRKHGFLPNEDDLEELAHPQLGTGVQLLQTLHSRPAVQVAALAKRDADTIRHFQRTADRLFIVAGVLQAKGRISDPRETSFYATEFQPALQAIDTQTTAEGAEFVPTQLSGDMIERIALELRVAALFPEITMPTNPFEIVGRGVSRIRGGRGVENTADTGQTLAKKITAATRKIQLDAAKFEAEMLFSKEADEDSIVAMLEFVEDELVDFLVADIEDAILNGDTAGAQDSDTSGSDDPRLNFNGLRKKALASTAKTDQSNAVLTVAKLTALRGKMGKYGIATQNLVNLTSMAGFIQLLADTNVLTMDKYGPQATIVTGELGKAAGVPIVVSEYQRQNLNASGVYDGVTTTRNTSIVVNRRGYLRGVRRELEVQVLRELYAEADQDAVIVRQRRAFESRYPASELTTAISYNGSTA